MEWAVFRPRCWSGKKRIFTLVLTGEGFDSVLSTLVSALFASAHSRTFRQFELVQTAPPCSPTNALIAALLFMYVIGTIVCPGQVSWSWAHASSVWSRFAM